MAAKALERMLVMPAQGARGDGGQLLQLPCPATGQQQQFLLTQHSLLELNRFKHRHSSWFVGDAVVADGCVYLASPMDVLYVLLPILDRISSQAAGSHMFCDVDTLLCQEDCPALSQLAPLARQHLPCICDVKGCAEDQYYRLNQQKVLAWLRCKVRQSQAAFQEVSPGSIAGLDDQGCLAYVLGFISEYLTSKWQAQLAQSYGQAPSGGAGAAVALHARPLNVEPTAVPAADAKRAKVTHMDPKEAAKKKAAESRAEAAKARLAQQAKGTKSISSFFAKKPQ